MAHNVNAVIVNALVRQALMAAQEVMGANGLNAVLRSSGLDRYVDHMPPDNLDAGVSAGEYARLNEAIAAFYGRGGKGMLKRIGRASFQYGVREQSALLGLAGVALKLLPPRQRIKLVLNNLAGALKKSNSQVEAWVEERGDRIAYLESTCAVCHGRQASAPICHLYVGSISEAVRWATGVEHTIIETHCMAMGESFCRFEVGEPLA